MNTISINIPTNFKENEEQFELLAIANRNLRLERTAPGELVIMPPTGGNTGRKNIAIEAQLWNWNEQEKLGVVFDSSTGFRLPNKADRSPDAAWVSKERWDALTPSQQETFPPLCPDFVIELRLSGDTMKPLREKMVEYIENGAKLGWLIDPKNQLVEIYRRDRKVEVLENPNSLSGEDILPNFVLDLRKIWN